MIHMVTYDLHNPGRDYEDVIEAIKSVGSWAHPQGSVWLVDTLLSPEAVREKVSAAGDSNDEYFVVQLRQNWATRNTDKAVIDWLNHSSRRW